MAHYRSQSGKTKSAIVTGTSAPPNAVLGQLWMNSNTGVTYQYTSDGASEFWLDITSGGIGMGESRSVDIVGDTDPHLETSTTGAGLAIGTIYYNREGDRYFVCTNTTTNGNQWAGRYAGYGGLETMYKSGTNFYKVHTFFTTGVLNMDKTTSCDILVVAGGGGGGGTFDTPGGGGGGAGGLLTFAGQSVAAGYHTCLVGNGGHSGYMPQSTTSNFLPQSGTNSQFGTLTACVGGGNGEQHHQAKARSTGGSGGGGGHSNTTGAAGTAGQGNSGGAGSGAPNQAGGGGGGSGGTGGGSSGVTGGTGGAGTANAYRTGSNVTYAAGGGGGSGYTSGNGGAGGSSITAINGGNYPHNAGGTGLPNTGHGGGGGSGRNTGSMSNSGGDGSSGIIVIRYQVA